MSINFHTDKIVFVVYPPGSGGKTLINSLGLSNSAVYQDAMLAQLQLKGGFDAADKFKYLIDKINLYKNNNTVEWDDLSLGCLQLFGLTVNDYYILEKNSYVDFYFRSIIEKIIDKNLYFFQTVHDFSSLAAANKFWPNAKYIIFDNSIKFLKNNSRKNYLNKILDIVKIQEIWDVIKGPDWPNDLPTVIFDDMPDHVKLELLEEDFNDLYRLLKKAEYQLFSIQNFFQLAETRLQDLGAQTIYRFDALTLLDPSKFQKEIIELMAALDMEIPNIDFIRQYHANWLSIL